MLLEELEIELDETELDEPAWVVPPPYSLAKPNNHA